MGGGGGGSAYLFEELKPTLPTPSRGGYRISKKRGPKGPRLPRKRGGGGGGGGDMPMPSYGHAILVCIQILVIYI